MLRSLLPTYVGYREDAGQSVSYKKSPKGTKKPGQPCGNGYISASYTCSDEKRKAAGKKLRSNPKAAKAYAAKVRRAKGIEGGKFTPGKGKVTGTPQKSAAAKAGKMAGAIVGASRGLSTRVKKARESGRLMNVNNNASRSQQAAAIAGSAGIAARKAYESTVAAGKATVSAGQAARNTKAGKAILNSPTGKKVTEAIAKGKAREAAVKKKFGKKGKKMRSATAGKGFKVR